MTIFTETLRRHWRQVLWWGGGMALLGYYIVTIIPNVDMLNQYADMIANLKPEFLALLGVQDAATIATPEGFIAMGFFGYALLMLAAFAVMAGLNMTANEEDEGILDVVLAQPVPRWRIIMEKFAAYFTLTLGVVAVSLGGLLLGMSGSSLGVDTGHLVQSTINMLPSLLLMIAFTMFVATVVRRRTTALALAVIFIVASFFVDFLGSSASGTAAEALRAFSFFAYYDEQTVILKGMDIGKVLILLAASGALLLGSLWFFERRDVGV
ncbi:MAG: ABC transporter permease subunit [Anaerolineae bacterium]|nr:ABC transporter permease subunit [Anaerolineae bacterium]